MKTPWIVAHRGASEKHPENSMISFRQALRACADGIELDVQWSRDFTPVVFHDRTLKTIDQKKTKISHLTYADIQKHITDPGLPDLGCVLKTMGSKTHWLIELKPYSLLTKRLKKKALRNIKTLMNRYNLNQKTFILSFDRDLLEIGASLFPRTRFVLNMDRPYPANKRTENILKKFYAVSVKQKHLNREFVNFNHRLGKPVMAFVCNDRKSLNKCLSWGVDVIMTDRPKWAKSFVLDQKQ